MSLSSRRPRIAAAIGCTAATAGILSLADAAPPIRFVDVSAERGIGPFVMAEGMGGGVAAADYDDDGDVDLFVPNGYGVADQLYRNLGDGRFEEIAAGVGLASTERSRVALWLDQDGDGDLDLLVADDREDAATAYRFYRHTGAGAFVDDTLAAGLAIAPPPRIDANVLPHRGGLCAGDLNGDGYLDVYSAQWNGDAHLLLNDGAGGFVDVTEGSGVLDALHYGHQPVMLDADRDGRLDIYAAIDFLENALWINRGDMTFDDVARDAHADNAMNDMGVAVCDYDNDGDLDLYVTNIFVETLHNILLQNESAAGAVRYREVARARDVDWGGWGWGATFLDADNDGWADIAATNGWITPTYAEDPSRFYWNRLGATDAAELAPPFADVSARVGFDDRHWGSALIALDADRDGDLDLVQACQHGPLRLLDNRRRGKPAGFLTVRPRTDGPNRRAIGAIVRVTAGSTAQMRLITAGTSYLGQEPAEAHFGLGDARRADVVVEWPDGRVTRVDDVAANRVLTVAPGRLR